MSHLPVFSTIGQALAVLGLYPGRLIKGLAVPAVLTAVLAAVAAGVAAWLLPDADLQSLTGGELVLAGASALALGALLLLIWTPYAIDINQLAVTGRTEGGGYAGRIFSAMTLRYYGYRVLVLGITIVGMTVSLLPLGIAAARDSSGYAGMALAGVCSMILVLAFLILTAPLALVYPAAAVEQNPSLPRAFDLGARSKLRLFACISLCAMLFAVLGILLDAPAAMANIQNSVYTIISLPAQIILLFCNIVATTALPAVAYRILRDLPDPRRTGPQEDHPQGPSC